MKTFLLTLSITLGILTSNFFSQAQEPGFDYQRDFKNILERTKNKYDTLYYLKLLTRFQENDSNLTRPEILALMIGYTESRFFKPYADMQLEKEIIELNDDGFYKDAITESRKYLQTHPLSLSINKECSFAYHQTRRRDSARYYMDMADMIMEAMIYSGKGRTPETAFFSLGLADGDYFIPNVGLTVFGRNTGKDRFKNFLYVVDAVSLEDVHTTYYFNIQHAKRKMDLEENPDFEAKPKKLKRGKNAPPPVPTEPPENPADSIIPKPWEKPTPQAADSTSPKIDSSSVSPNPFRDASTPEQKIPETGPGGLPLAPPGRKND